MALILIDLGKQNYKLMVGHFLFSFIAVLLMVYLSQNDLDFVAWGIFLIPLVLLTTGLIIGAVNAAPGTGTPPPPVTVPASVLAPADPKKMCDASGNPIPPPAPTIVSPSASIPCGSGSGSGKTQCIDTSKLTSA
jgi:hypothetical protein